MESGNWEFVLKDQIVVVSVHRGEISLVEALAIAKMALEYGLEAVGHYYGNIAIEVSYRDKD